MLSNSKQHHKCTTVTSSNGYSNSCRLVQGLFALTHMHMYVGGCVYHYKRMLCACHISISVFAVDFMFGQEELNNYGT